jgi:imidazoleglycerol-phosphate dehydratase
MRKAQVERKTKETTISLTLALDGQGSSRAKTGVGFLDHMLDLLARHAGFDLTVKAKGDLHVDDHHLVEDVGIVFGEALKKALAKKEGINRYGWAAIPMDESLVLCALDLGGRPYLDFGLEIKVKRIKAFETELIEEFYRAVVNSAGLNLHLRQLAGRNTHHIIEASFKAFARALGQAVAPSGRAGVPSTKGVL